MYENIAGYKKCPFAENKEEEKTHGICKVLWKINENI
jgi:hypothetical protein